VLRFVSSVFILHIFVFHCQFQCDALVCVLRCVAECCGMLQCAVTLQRGAVCCGVSQCVTVYYSVLQCVAVFCSVSQAVCCSVILKSLFLKYFFLHREFSVMLLFVLCSVLQCGALCCSVF